MPQNSNVEVGSMIAIIGSKEVSLDALDGVHGIWSALLTMFEA